MHQWHVARRRWLTTGLSGGSYRRFVASNLSVHYGYCRFVLMLVADDNRLDLFVLCRCHLHSPRRTSAMGDDAPAIVASPVSTVTTLPNGPSYESKTNLSLKVLILSSPVAEGLPERVLVSSQEERDSRKTPT